MNPEQKILLSLILLLHLACCLTTQAQERQLKPLPINEALKTWSLPAEVPVSLSPDGQWVAYTLQKAQRLGAPAQHRYSLVTPTGVRREIVGSDVLIANIQTGESRNLTNGVGTNWSPSWSPDGRYIAFTSDRGGQSQLWLWDKSADKLRLASGQILNANFLVGSPYQWTPDGNHIVVRLLPEGMSVEDLLDLAFGAQSQPIIEDEQMRPTVTVAESHATSGVPPDRHSSSIEERFFDICLSDIAVIEIGTGSIRRVGRKLRLDSFSVSPNGSYIAAMSYSGQAAANSQQTFWNLSIASLGTGTWKIIDTNLLWDYKLINWSPDGTSVVFGTHGPHDANELHYVSVNGGDSRTLPLPQDFSYSDQLSPLASPWLWDGHGRNLYSITINGLWRIRPTIGEAVKIAEIPGHTLLGLIGTRDNFRLWSPDTNESAVVLARNSQTLWQGLFKVDLFSGRFTKLLEESETIWSTDASAVGGTLAYVAQSAQRPPDVWILGSKLGSPKRVTDSNGIFDGYQLGTSRLIRWRSLDGQDLKGALLLPPGYKDDERCPLIVYVYGGYPLSTIALNDWNSGVFNMQLLATRGYAILFPDAPENVGTPMQDLAKTVLPGVEKVLDLGIGDPNRVGVMGHSYGGYSALALVEQSKQFKAAIAISGPVSLANAYVKTGTGGGGVGWAEEGQGKMGGSLWEYRDRFIENSPLFYLDRVQAPVLLIHGEFDETIPVTESRIAFESLRRLGKEVVYAEYKVEGHRVADWSYANQVDLCNRVIYWFDEHLKAKSLMQHNSASAVEPKPK